MAEKKLYTCDVCHTDYASEEDAIECEKSHSLSTEIKNFRYTPYSTYPHKVLVKFTDGKGRWYKE